MTKKICKCKKDGREKIRECKKKTYNSQKVYKWKIVYKFKSTLM